MRGSDRARIKDEMQQRLGKEDATKEDRNRFRLRRAVGDAAFELRCDPWRIFYRVVSGEIRVLLIGKKVRESIVIDGKKYVL